MEPNHKVTGAKLLITADVEAGGSCYVGSSSVDGTDSANAIALISNVTDTPMVYKSGADFSAVVGKEITLYITLKTATVYTVGWSS